MPLNNRAPAAPIGKLTKAPGVKRKRSVKRSKPSAKRSPRRKSGRKLSAKQRKYFGKRRKR